MKTSTKHFISLFLALFVLSSISFAQITVTVADVGGDYLSIKHALDSATVDMDSAQTLIINIPEGTKVEPTGNLFVNWGKALNIVVNGAGADKTIITRTDTPGVPELDPAQALGDPLTGPPAIEGDGVSGRMFQIGAGEMAGSTLTFKNLTFRYMGSTSGGQTTGSIMNFVNEWDLVVTYENVVFDQCAGRALINHNKDRHDFVFDNCLFIGCMAITRLDNTAHTHQGLIHRGFGGNLTVKNTTFMSNTIITPAEYDGNSGGLIRTASDRGWISNVVLENVIAVNSTLTD
jgi:hypothetical protein